MVVFNNGFGGCQKQLSQLRVLLKLSAHNHFHHRQSAGIPLTHVNGHTLPKPLLLIMARIMFSLIDLLSLIFIRVGTMFAQNEKDAMYTKIS